MPRVKRGSTTRARHKKILSTTKGYRHGRKNLIRQAKQAQVRAGQYSYRDRKVKKRLMRRSWIGTINAAVRPHDLTYSIFIAGLQKTDLDLDRKILAALAINEPEKFSQIIEKVKAVLK